jgi:hypothetical protein
MSMSRDFRITVDLIGAIMTCFTFSPSTKNSSAFQILVLVLVTFITFIGDKNSNHSGFDRS